MIRLSLVIGVALLLLGCSVRVPPVPPSPPVVSFDAVSPTATGSPSPVPSGPAAPGSAATLPPILSGVHVGITRICEGPPEGEVELVDWCRHGIRTAIDSLGPDADRVAAAWYRRGIACPPNARCVGPTPDVGHVVVRLADGPVLVVPLQFVTEGIAAAPATTVAWDIWPQEPVPVQTPAPPAELGPAAPLELRNREPFPFCGSEDDVFDRNVRRCFWDAVTLQHAPAEFITAVAAADGSLVQVVHRYAGAGGILVYRSPVGGGPEAAWSKESCALESIGDDELLFVVEACARLPLD